MSIFRLNDQYKRIFFSMSGRLTRSEFWLYSLLPYAMLAIAYYELYQPLMLITRNLFGLGTIISMLFMLVLVVFSFSVFVKRLHDLNKSAWSLLILFIPIAGMVYLTVITAFHRGDEEENQYGVRDGDDDVRAIYLSSQNFIEKQLLRGGYQKFLMLSVVILSAFFAVDYYSLVTLDQQVYTNFGLVGVVIMSWFNIYILICVFTVILYITTGDKRKLGYQVSLGLVLFLLLTIIGTSISNVAYTFYRIDYILEYLAPVLALSIATIIIYKRELESKLYILGLVLVVFSISLLLSELDSIFSYGLKYGVKLLEYLPFLQIGLFIMIADQAMSKQEDDSITNLNSSIPVVNQ